MQQRILAVPGVPERQYSQLKAGPAGTIFYLEASAAAGGGRGGANRQTVLAVNNKPVLEGARQVTVLPVASEQALRGRAWIESNRRFAF